MKKDIKRNIIIASIITVIAFLMFGLHTLRLVNDIFEYGYIDPITFLGLTVVAFILYVIWMLALSYPKKFMRFLLFLCFDLLSILALGSLLNTLGTCSGPECIDLGLGGLAALGVGIIVAFLASVYYLITAKQTDSGLKKKD